MYTFKDGMRNATYLALRIVNRQLQHLGVLRLLDRIQDQGRVGRCIGRFLLGNPFNVRRVRDDRSVLP